MLTRLIPMFFAAVAMAPLVVMVTGQSPTEQELQQAVTQAKADVAAEEAANVVPGSAEPEESPFSGALNALAREHRSTPMAKELSRCATVLEKVAKYFMSSSRRRSYTIAMLSAIDSQTVTSVCDVTSMKPITCPSPAVPEFRSANGRCNNRHNPLWGSSEEPLIRLLEPEYGDGLMTPRRTGHDGAPLPSARLVSTTMHEDLRKSSLVNTHMVMQFGQFLDHDITLTPNFQEEGLVCSSEVGADWSAFCNHHGNVIDWATANIQVVGQAVSDQYRCPATPTPGSGDQKRTTFPSPRSTSNYVRLMTSLSQDLRSFTLCLHMRTDMSSSSDAALVSYAVTQQANELLVFNKGGRGLKVNLWDRVLSPAEVGADWSAFCNHHGNVIDWATANIQIVGQAVSGDQKRTTFPSPRSTSNYLFIQGQEVVLGPLPVWDGARHALCVTWRSSDGAWQVFADGVLKNSGSGFCRGDRVRSGGTLILAQEQDRVGGGFDRNQAFSGELSQVNLWYRVLSPAEVGADWSAFCNHHGNVIDWATANIQIVGQAVSGQEVVLGPLPVWDGARHALCVTWRSSDGSWQVFADGVLKNSGSRFRRGDRVRSGGTLILAQEQDRVGGGFARNQAFSGELSQVNLWDRVLSPAEVGADWSAFCNHHGNVIDWATANIQVVGQAVSDQYRCPATPTPGSGDQKRTTFPSPRSTNNYVRLMTPLSQDLRSFTLCLHMRTDMSSSSDAALVSYAVTQQANELLVFNKGGRGFKLYIQGQEVVLGPLPVWDGARHALCVTWRSSDGSWQVFADGVLKNSGSRFRSGGRVRSGGTLILAQEQDRVGGGFARNQAFSGELSQVNLWDRVLSPAEVGADWSAFCNHHGNVIDWATANIQVVGQAVSGQYRCPATPTPGSGARGLLKSRPNPADENKMELLPGAKEGGLPCAESPGNETCSQAGDIRVNEQPGLTSMHTVFLREHNRIARRLSQLNPHWDDDRVFFETRKIVGALMQKITYGEDLPHVLGPAAMTKFHLTLLQSGFFSGYDASVNPTISNVFATAAYRFGHSLVDNLFLRYDPDFNEASACPIRLAFAFFTPSHIFNNDQGGPDSILRGLTAQPHQDFTRFMVSSLTKQLFADPPGSLGLDLAALNIQRGRDHGLPGYNAWRVRCGLPRANSFDELASEIPDGFSRKRLEKLYSHVDDIDVFVGGLAEESVPGGVVGPTFACLIGLQFQALRKGDRFWFENRGQFTAAQLAEIRKTSLARILCDNTDGTTHMQPDVFMLPTQTGNERVACSSLSQMDLTKWQESVSNSRGLPESLEGENATMSGREFEDHNAENELERVAEEARDLLELLRGKQEDIYREENAGPSGELDTNDIGYIEPEEYGQDVVNDLESNSRGIPESLEGENVVMSGREFEDQNAENELERVAEEARDLLELLRGKQEDLTPPEEDLTPPEEDLTPPEENLTPPEEDLTPPEENLTPPEEDLTPSEEDLTLRGEQEDIYREENAGPGGGLDTNDVRYIEPEEYGQDVVNDLE
ncbi:PREDICTED: uncharacterized protein LOC109463095 [Branchiostoma belcheri]|uniref:Uncharacterized protein LOC109463095 n=1 Tax=Branchiostoma belcheri TaxID=7741 RepID=A0A6P4XFR2_BRABE|nr:PREDICTED: uncharacterized protein LOC109463095 [Branchiostoma belcheri]